MKQNMYDHSIQVPFIIRAGRSAGRRVRLWILA